MTESGDMWSSPPAETSPSEEDVHVWLASLEGAGEYIERLAVFLGADETAQAARFRFERHRVRFVARRGLLRAILGRYLGLEPGRLRFGQGRFGKPFLADPTDAALRFNTSHSEGLVLFAVSWGREVGVDVERVRPMGEEDMEEIAAHFFSSVEKEEFDALRPDMRLEAFFNCWVRKEAYIKGRGEGLSLSPERFEVSLSPSPARVTLRTPDDPRASTAWSLRPLDVGPGYASALAVEGRGCGLSCIRWDFRDFSGPAWGW